jgi:hypothetical protein
VRSVNSGVSSFGDLSLSKAFLFVEQSVVIFEKSMVMNVESEKLSNYRR